jgi:hypothetical protein
MNKAMNTRLMTGTVAFALAAANAWAADDKITEQEAAILALVLRQPYTGTGYTVVSAETKIAHVDFGKAAEVEQSKKYVRERFEADNIDAAKLIDRLFDRNKKSVRLTIKSSPEDGYVVDRDGKFARYFKGDGGGWEQWRHENPIARSSTTVSLPVHDEKSGLVMVYVGTQKDWLVGSGWIILYKYEKGQLRQVAKVMMWIS